MRLPRSILARLLYALSALLFVVGVVGELASDQHGAWGFLLGTSCLLAVVARWRAAVVDDRAQYEPLPQPGSTSGAGRLAGR